MKAVDPLPRAAHPTIVIPIVAAAFLLLACNDSNSVIDRQEIDRLELERMRREILALVADLSCSKSSDCATIAFGTKPCGGPWEYLIYSTAHVNVALLQAEVAAFNEANREYNRRHGVLSDCVLAPGVHPACVDGTCVDLSGLQQATGAPASAGRVTIAKSSGRNGRPGPR